MSTFLFAFKSDFFEVAKQMEIYTTLFKELNLYYIDEINPAALTEKAINEMLEDLDPYTKYYDEQGVEEVKINSSGEYSGIGAESRYYDNKLVIAEVYEGYSAEEEGVKVGDEILLKHDLTHQDFANLTATSRQTVTVTLNELRDKDLIYMERKKILIRDIDKLE